MALKKYIVDLMQDNSLNGISTYKDVLTLSSGVISRKIKKIILTGQETWYSRSGSPANIFFIEFPNRNAVDNIGVCSHYINQNTGSAADLEDKHVLVRLSSTDTKFFIMIRDSTYSTDIAFKTYIQQQYASGTPVTVWYVLATESTEQITVPTGLSGTVDGYTTQTGTPTPTDPIYPTANTVTMWANYTPSRYNGSAFVTGTGQPEQYDGGWT